ncbi:hypothetical protein [Pararhizobium sp. DWP1-1-3]|uniref:hypothetical protein n=1 Tax=Pararhizobium sp. DWP1-1-3 TaxID=2804652 RepID=UPI003CF694D0
MTTFSIDLAADRIVDARTRSYFDEVSRSYANGCYRSSLVMLWTVVICDLVYKLQTLRDMYGDKGAGALLDEVEKKQTASPNNPDWENYLLDEVAKRTKMLEASDHVRLQHLQKLRHLSAHPVLTAGDLLFQPSKDDVRAQIRMALEALLLRPPLFSKKIIGALINDISVNRAYLISRDRLKSYVEARYLPNMPTAIERELFRTLWKFCFKLNNADAQTNRQVNLDMLAILYVRNSGEVRKTIDDDRAFFSNVGPDVQPLDSLIGFLNEHAALHASLNADAHVMIDARIEADINNRAKASFKSPTFADHLTELEAQESRVLAKLEEVVWKDLLQMAKSEGCLLFVQRIGIKVYVNSPGFDAADRRFACFIEPLLQDFVADNLEDLLGGIETNSQTYGRGRASYDHPKVKEVADTHGVSTARYVNFSRSL